MSDAEINNGNQGVLRPRAGQNTYNEQLVDSALEFQLRDTETDIPNSDNPIEQEHTELEGAELDERIQWRQRFLGLKRKKRI